MFTISHLRDGFSHRLRAFVLHVSSFDLVTKILLSAVFIQFCTWLLFTQYIKPDFTITPYPPSQIEMAILSLGDNQMLYRILGQNLQNAGDTFGETIPLQNYDYEMLERWFYALDTLDQNSTYVPSLATFYYGLSQNGQDTRYIINYVMHFADRNPQERWRWYIDAYYLAAHRLKDMSIVKKIGDRLKDPYLKLPIWAKTIVPFVLADHGDKCAAYDLIVSLDDVQFTSAIEDEIFLLGNATNRNFLMEFLVKRVGDLKNNPQLIAQCRTKHTKK